MYPASDPTMYVQCGWVGVGYISRCSNPLHRILTHMVLHVDILKKCADSYEMYIKQLYNSYVSRVFHANSVDLISPTCNLIDKLKFIDFSPSPPPLRIAVGQNRLCFGYAMLYSTCVVMNSVSSRISAELQRVYVFSSLISRSEFRCVWLESESKSQGAEISQL